MGGETNGDEGPGTLMGSIMKVRECCAGYSDAWDQGQGLGREIVEDRGRRDLQHADVAPANYACVALELGGVAGILADADRGMLFRRLQYLVRRVAAPSKGMRRSSSGTVGSRCRHRGRDVVGV